MPQRVSGIALVVYRVLYVNPPHHAAGFAACGVGDLVTLTRRDQGEDAGAAEPCFSDDLDGGNVPFADFLAGADDFRGCSALFVAVILPFDCWTAYFFSFRWFFRSL